VPGDIVVLIRERDISLASVWNPCLRAKGRAVPNMKGQ